jgi:hypothetical protein
LSKTRIDSTFQREFSLLDNQPRNNPIHPLRVGRGIVAIGNRRMPVQRAPRYWSQDELNTPKPRNEAAALVEESERR